MATTKITSNLVADDAITLAKMAGGTDGQILTYDASGNPVAVGPGTDGQVLTSTGAGRPPAFADAGGGGYTTVEFSSTSSGASLLFSSIPAGTTSVFLHFSAVSTDSASPMDIRLGDAGGIETSGYSTRAAGVDSSVSLASSTNGFAVTGSGHASNVLNGHIHLSRGNTLTHFWSISGSLVEDNQVGDIHIQGGTKTLSAELTQIQIIMDDGAEGDFDAGSIGISYL